MLFRIIILLTILADTSGLSQTVQDADGNEYGTVVIGSQIWINSNLKNLALRLEA
jgi:hypothetical protein